MRGTIQNVSNKWYLALLQYAVWKTGPLVSANDILQTKCFMHRENLC